MPHDGALAAETKSWLAKAAGDLEAATHDMRADPPLLEDIVFHAQQAVEKTLKGFLTWHGRIFRKTHNLVELGGMCRRLAPEMEEVLGQAAPLTEYAWKFRYPGDPDKPSRDEATEALAIAQKVFCEISRRLPFQARP